MIKYNAQIHVCRKHSKYYGNTIVTTDTLAITTTTRPLHSQSPVGFKGHGGDSRGWHELETERGLEPGW